MEPQQRLHCALPFIRRLRPPPSANDSQTATKVATHEPTESEPTESEPIESEPTESEPKEAEGPHNLNINKPDTRDSALAGDVVNANPDCSDAIGDVVNVEPNSRTKKTTGMAPNRVVNWEDLKCTVDSHLGKCIGCKGSGLHLAEKSTCSFASTLEIVCGECDTAQEKSWLEIRHMKKNQVMQW